LQWHIQIVGRPVFNVAVFGNNLEYFDAAILRCTTVPVALKFASLIGRLPVLSGLTAAIALEAS